MYTVGERVTVVLMKIEKNNRQDIPKCLSCDPVTKRKITAATPPCGSTKLPFKCTTALLLQRLQNIPSLSSLPDKN